MLPPNLRDWLPEDHLAWFVLDAVGAMDLEAFFAVENETGARQAGFQAAETFRR